MPKHTFSTIIEAALSRTMMAIITGYRNFIRPFIGYSCRYYPTCTEYTKLAILQHGGYRGTYLGFKRLLRCHPFHQGGCDPVPPLSKKRVK